MPVPLIAAGGATAGGIQLVEEAGKKKGGIARALQLVRSARIVWWAVALDFTQLIFGLLTLFIFVLGIGGAEIKETFLPSTGSVLTSAVAFLFVGGGAAIEYFATAAGLVMWFITIAIAVLGYLGCAIAFKINGIHVIGEKKAAAKLTVLILCITADFLFPVNGLLPGLSLWAIYLTLNPE